MVFINGIKFYDNPDFCGRCASWNNGRTHLSLKDSAKGHCLLFDKTKNQYDKTPLRCRLLFNKAFSHTEGTELVIVINQ